MIDLHCHILPAIDDGPPEIEGSLKMVRTAADDGVTHIVATPHFLYEEKQKAEEIGPSLKVLAGKVNKSGIPVTLLSGADIRLSYALLEGIKKKDVPTINKSRYFLIELPEPIPPNLAKFFSAAEMNGFVAIITHPERNSSLLASPDKIEALRDLGALFQVTAMSVTGEFGGRLKSFCQMLFRRGFADFVASDAHDPFIRKPGLSKAYKEVVGLRGQKEAETIFFENPAAVIENRAINTG